MHLLVARGGIDDEFAANLDLQDWIRLTDREKGNFGKVFKKTNFRNRIILISWRKVKSIAEFN